MSTDVRALFQVARREVDLPSVVGRHTHLRRTGRDDYRGACPLHGGDNRAAFHVYRSPVDQRWWWTCHTHCGSGSIIDLMVILYGDTPIQALERVMGGQAWAGQAAYRAPAPAPEPAPLEPMPIDRARRFHHLLARTASDGRLARDWWRDRGVTESVIDQAMLGYCPRCPTMFDEDHPDRVFDSLTIPIFDPDGGLLNVRHRVLSPPNPKDKYRPDRKGAGLGLYGVNWIPDNEERLIILEGEIKLLVWRSFGLHGVASPISGTGGVRSWQGAYGDRWYDLIAERFPRVREVYTLYDPDAHDSSWHTARRFGKRGRQLLLPEKVDDYLLERGEPDAAMQHVIRLMASARPVTTSGYWNGYRPA